METAGKNVLFFEICRLCLENQGICVVSKRNGLFDKIYNCTGVEIKSCDNLPQEICSLCLDIVNKADSLRTLALKNATHLKTLFSECTECENTSKRKSCIVSKGPSSSYVTVRSDLFQISDVSSQSIDDFKTPSTEKSKKNDDSRIQFECTMSSHSMDDSKTPSTKKRKKNDDSRNEFECTVSSQSTDDVSTPSKYKSNNSRTEYECIICAKVYDSWKKLYFHNKTHNKNIHCPLDECKKVFATKGDLEKHIRSHTGEKPFHCDECDKSFAQKGTLKAHKSAVHNLVFS